MTYIDCTLGTNWVQVPMSKNIEQECLSKNGGRNYYIQFHIKPWMRQFRQLDKYKDRKNFKQSLRTPSLTEALRLLHLKLMELGLYWSDIDNQLLPVPIKDHERNTFKSEEAEYFHNLDIFDNLDSSDVEQVNEIEDEIYTDQMQYGPDGKLTKSELTKKYKARKAATKRLNLSESERQLSPHAYVTTLTLARDLLVDDYTADKRNKKEIGKVYTSVSKFFSFLGVEDIPLNHIKQKIVKNYIRHSRDEGIPKNTFKTELGKLGQIFKIAQDEEYVDENIKNPFTGHLLKNFKAKQSKALYEPKHAELLATEAFELKRLDILITVAVSFYTGMRSSELYHCVLREDETKILYFDILDGKTESSIRPAPLHPALEKWLTDCNLMPEINNGFDWNTPSDDAFNKSFNRFNRKHFIKKLNISEENGKYSHHSFRHGMATRLYDLGYSELQVADVVGHSRNTVARTESGKTYIKKKNISKIYKLIEDIEPIGLPKWNTKINTNS